MEMHGMQTEVFARFRYIYQPGKDFLDATLTFDKPCYGNLFLSDWGNTWWENMLTLFANFTKGRTLIMK